MCARLLLLAALITAASGVTFAQAAIGGDVDSLLGYARDHHPELAAMRHEAAAAEARIGSAAALPDPMFGVEWRDFTNEANGGAPNLLPARVGATRYALTQGLPGFGKRELRRDVAAAGADEAQQRAAATWVDLAWQIKQAYAAHFQQQARLDFGRDNLDALARLEQIAQARYAGGLAAQQDVIRARTEHTALRGELALLEGDNRQVVARLHGLLGGRPAVALQAPSRLRPLPSPAHLDGATLAARLVDRNPRLAADAARQAGAEKSRELAYRNRYPDFSVGVAAMQERSRISSYDLMFEVSIPLQQDSRRAQEREAERMVDAAQARRAATLNQVRAELDESLVALQASQQVEALLASSLLPLAELNVQTALAGYETGKVDFAAVLDALRQSRQAKEDLVRARVAQQQRLADIERAIGEDL